MLVYFEVQYRCCETDRSREWAKDHYSTKYTELVVVDSAEMIAIEMETEVKMNG